MILMNSLYHYSDPDFYLLCVRFYVDDFVLHAQAPFSIGWCVSFFLVFGFFPSVICLWLFGSGKNKRFWCCTFLLYMVLLHFWPQYSVPLLYYSTFLPKKCILGFGYDMNSFGNDLSLSTLHSPLHNNTGIGETLLLVWNNRGIASNPSHPPTSHLHIYVHLCQPSSMLHADLSSSMYVLVMCNTIIGTLFRMYLVHCIMIRVEQKYPRTMGQGHWIIV